MPEIKLKPCPFCGGEAEIVEKAANFLTTTIVYVECKECYASPYIHDKYSDYYSKDWVIEQWNRRAENETD